jgi:hypothetical protein
MGGSFGIAIITFITWFSQEHRVNLVAHLGTKFEVQQRYSFYKRFMSKVYRKWINEKKHIKQLIIPSWNKVPCYLIWIFFVFRYSISVLYSNYIPNQKEKQNQSCDACIKTIKKLRLNRVFLYSYKILSYQMIPADRVASNW